VVVDVYSLPTDAQKTSRSRLFAQVLICFAFCSVGYFVLDVYWPFSHQTRSFAGSATKSLMWSALMTLFMVIRSAGHKAPYNITVDGDLIVVKGLGGFRKVHRGEIKTIVEWKPNFFRDGGIMLSDRGRFGTFMWGGVWIPRTLPEYEYLKSVAEMWKANDPEEG
jgi:hypothetical protein